MTEVFQNICRTCLIETNESVSLTKTLKLKLNQCFTLAEMLNDFTNLNVSSDDLLPFDICIGCMMEIRRTFLFKQKCKEANAILFNLLDEEGDFDDNIDETRDYTESDSLEILEESLDENMEPREGSLHMDLDIGSAYIEDEAIHIKKEISSETIEDHNEVSQEILSNLQAEKNEAASDNEGTQYKCNFCELHFFNTVEFNEHLELHNIGKFNFCCEYCNRKFRHPEPYENHLKLHTGGEIKIYTCTICNKEFDKPASLRIHLNIHSNVTYKCDFCDKSYTRKQILTKHIVTAHEINKLPLSQKFLCDLCGKALPSENELKIHERIHTGEKPFICSECGKGYISKARLKAHQYHHRPKDKIFTCDVCDKTFSRQEYLTKHKRIHTGIRPHKCELCDKTFLEKQNLKLHLRSHYGEKPYRKYEASRKPRIRSKNRKNKIEVADTE